MLGLTLAVIVGTLWVTGRRFADESVRVFEFGIVHREEALVVGHVFSTETGFAMSPSAIPIKDHTDSVDGVRRPFFQLLNLMGLQRQSRSFRDWYSLHPCFDDWTPS
jgi:hypothetical protein